MPLFADVGVINLAEVGVVPSPVSTVVKEGMRPLFIGLALDNQVLPFEYKRHNGPGRGSGVGGGSKPPALLLLRKTAFHTLLDMLEIQLLLLLGRGSILRLS